MRRDVDEKFVKEGIVVSSIDIKEGVIFDEDGVTVTAVLVDHRPIEPAFGYRVDYQARGERTYFGCGPHHTSAQVIFRTALSRVRI